MEQLGALVYKAKPTATVVGGDFNNRRNNTNCVARVLQEGASLGMLHLDYPLGEYTNYVHKRDGDMATEIVYILHSRYLRVVHKRVSRGVSTHALLWVQLTSLPATTVTTYSKHYRHRGTPTVTLQALPALTGLFWCWPSRQVSHPDVWIHAYLMLADSLLPPALVRGSAVSMFARGRCVLRKGVTPAALAHWHQDMGSHMLLKGFQSEQSILQSISLTSHTPKAPFFC